MLNKVFKLRSSVAIVQNKNNVEFFKTGTRESLTIRINNSNVFAILSQFDGQTALGEVVSHNSDVDAQELIDFVVFLNRQQLLIEVDKPYKNELVSSKYRIIGFLEDYYARTSEVISALANIEESKVAIFGLGAVGTWVCKNLALSGVKKFLIIDPDLVEISNLHRQDFYGHSDIGKKKADVVEAGLKEIDSAISVEAIDDFLDEDFFSRNLTIFDLAINCADSPNVDITSKLIGKECMARGVPHIIGGGYNLHLSLVGQSVIPGVSSCVRCYEISCADKEGDYKGVRKLYRPNRKIGSFAPLSLLSASITSEEAIKVILKLYESMITLNARLEFDLRTKDYRREAIIKSDDCEWCNSLMTG